MNVFQKVIINTYKSIANLVLTVLIVGVLWFLSLLCFYMANNTWIAPTVLSITSDKMLQFLGGYQQVRQTETTLKLALSQAKRDQEYSETVYHNLFSLSDDVKKYNGNVVGLERLKSEEIKNQQLLITRLATLKDQTAISAKVGLITAQEATQIQTTIQQFVSANTDAKIQLGTLDVTTKANTIQLLGQLHQSLNDIQTKRETVAAAEENLHVIETELKTMQSSAYFETMNDKGANLAFVPYDTVRNTRVGMKVYDCYLHNIVCRQVGSVVAIYPDEQLVQHPLFKVQTRGVLIKLQLTDQKAMFDKVLFVGGKPFGF